MKTIYDRLSKKYPDPLSIPHHLLAGKFNYGKKTNFKRHIADKKYEINTERNYIQWRKGFTL